MSSYPHAIRLRGPWEYRLLSRDPIGDGGNRCDDEGRFAPAGTTTLPGDWGDLLGRDFSGRVLYRRHFHRPSGLDSHERVWLVVEGTDGRASVALNGRRLGDVHGYALHGEFDVTETVEPSNELTLEVELPGLRPGEIWLPRPGREGKPGGPLGEVRLEVRSSVFISELAVWTQAEQSVGSLHVSGRISGDDSWPSVAVVVAGCERELIYGEFRIGERFERTALVSELARWPVNPRTRSANLECGDSSPPLSSRWTVNPGTRTALPVEIKLVAGGASVWHAIRRTACPRFKWEPAVGRLAMGDERVEWPVTVLDLPAREMNERRFGEWLASLRLPSDAVVGLREILADASYGRFDVAGCPVVQFVPWDWAHEVCARLAHHPSIVAWTASGVEIAQARHERLTRLGFGRPWIASETAFG